MRFPLNLKMNRKILWQMFFLFIQLLTRIKICLWDGMQILIMKNSIKKQIIQRYFTRQAFSINIAGYLLRDTGRQTSRLFLPPTSKQAEAALDTAYEDVKAAFEYYLKNYNHGRPIIIASHSQGTMHAGKLLKEFFEGKPLQKQLVCAYIIGLPVFANYFSQMKPCEDSASTGCFISWRTFEEGYVSPLIEQEKLKAYVINPLTWTMDTVLAPSELNKGGILRNFNKVIPGLVHAQIHGNILWVNKPKFFGRFFLQ